MGDINFDTIWSLISSYSLKILGSIAILLIGKWLVDRVSKLLSKVITVSKFDETLSRFILNVIKTLLIVFVIIAAISNLGIETSMFVAAFGALGLAIGMAFKDTFSNIGAGILIVFFRPFKIGDTVEVSGVLGVVSEISIFSTILKTGDNKTIIVPNGQIINDNIINYSKEGTRRVEIVFGIDYNDDLKLAKEIILKIANENPKVLKNPVPFVGVSSLGDNSVNLAARLWCLSGDFMDVQFSMLEAVKLEFDNQGISIPFPQLNIHYPQKKQSE
ncbi:mechanosensitive ion channel family protein [Campylobacter sp. MOP7]|uniref:mechanosensitive ion channel family protein n=1 Tax=Campylobacter canis TaxID=3378588 RepID=UPI00387E4ED5